VVGGGVAGEESSLAWVVLDLDRKSSSWRSRGVHAWAYGYMLSNLERKKQYLF
jgi:hypothetical protein